MTNYEKIKEMSKEELKAFLIDIADDAFTPWSVWFDENYCMNDSNCPTIIEPEECKEYSYCECNDHCKIACEKFGEHSFITDYQIISLWMEEEFPNE